MKPRIPLSTYRLQFSRNFTFKDAKVLVGYLKKLGIDTLYSSPIMKARKGSVHGYDITDYSQLNPEIGTEDEFVELADTLKTNDMGLIVDIVPNHMLINDPANKWWWDVLENGKKSVYAKFFDIDWTPPKKELVDKVLLPLLDQQFGKVLESGQISISVENGTFLLNCQQNTLPLNPKSWKAILDPVAEKLSGILPHDDPFLLELQSISFTIDHLPETGETDARLIEESQREKEVIKNRLAVLLDNSKEIASAIDQELLAINGNSSDPYSFKRLEEILIAQSYRLSYWRVANEEINYRRFFDVNDLAGIRTELFEVFCQVHEVVLKLISRGWITGLRIDHVDGLLDPERYFFDLQKACYEAITGVTADFSEIDRGFYITVEKILCGEETLLPNWLVQGTTGYEALNLINGIFIDSGNYESITGFYRRFTEQFQKIPLTIYEAKNSILMASMASELYVLSRLLDIISEQHHWTRDFTRDTLRSALRSVIASFPVYRSYIRPDQGVINESDRLYILAAVKNAKKMNPATSGSVFDFIQSVLLLEYPEGLSEEQILERQNFVMRFQQLTGPVMAKGLEDTAFYRFYPLASINEVGGELQRCGVSPEKFHNQNDKRQKLWPHSMIATSTHDTKRSEDVRARINVLSEIPEEWQAAVLRWNVINSQLKNFVDEEPVPDTNEEYLIYQTLIGSWPLELLALPSTRISHTISCEGGQDVTSDSLSNAREHCQTDKARAFESEDGVTDCPDSPRECKKCGLNKEILENYTERIVVYMYKAMKEAKLHSSWINPNEEHEKAVESFIRQILDPDKSQQFIEDFLAFIPLINRCGLYNSLSQVLIKSTCPGVPDFFQGCELWNFSLVDPDNRRPVDFKQASDLLEEVIRDSADKTSFIDSALQDPHVGKIKMYITRQSLLMRQKHPDLFGKGSYVPLEITGEEKHLLIAFARSFENKSVIILAGRFFTKFEKDHMKPLGEKAWGKTRIDLPVGTYRDILTGREHIVSEGKLSVSEICTHLPLALMEKL